VEQFVVWLKVKPTTSRVRVDQPTQKAGSELKEKIARALAASLGSFHIAGCQECHGQLRLVPSPIARRPEELILGVGFK
jgi:hypothetical protein